MKVLYCLIICFAASFSLFAQETATVDSTRLTFSKVEIEASFPGGDHGWIKFLQSHLTYPPKAIRKKVDGTVVVQFIVDVNGELSDIQAISGPDLLKPAALDVLKQSPRWKPAVQDGKKVKSYRKQPITFKLV
jgi:protein TonB